MEHDTEQNIQKYGWSTIKVFDGDPPFLYTIGLMQSWSHPELIIFGLESDTAHHILSNMVENIRTGAKYTHSESYGGILTGDYKIAIRNVHQTQHQIYLGYAMGYCRAIGRPGQLKAFQIFWPDKTGKFPFETGFEPELTPLQPRLDMPVAPSEMSKFSQQWG